jgi:hypothetical protein
MKKFLQILGFIVLLLVVLVAAALTYVKTMLPNIGAAEEITVELTPERIERGRYLANTVTVCMDCHSTRDWSKFSGPITPGTLGQGGDRFDQSVGMPGVFYAKNITPTGIGRYTDGELFRVITTGVNKEGKAMFPLMPFLYYGKMDREDIYSIIAYIRTLEPIAHAVAESVPDFPMNFIINTLPQMAAPQPRPDPSDQLAYGAYLVNASGCVECHTQVEKGQIIKSLAFSGGREFMFPDGGIVRSSNISSDPKTGIGRWTERQFVARFKNFADSAYTPPTVGVGEYNTIMPWTMYGGMKEEDLMSIFTFLQTVEPIANKVTLFSPPPSR